MKKNRIYQFAMCALTAGILASCSEDVQQPDVVVGPDGATAYAKVCITFPGNNRFVSRAFGSDANEFENGTDTESTINKLLLVFYDEDGRAVGQTLLSKDETNPDLKLLDPTPQTGSVQDVYNKTVPVNLVPGSKIPTHIMCYANPQSVSDQFANMFEIPSKERTDYKSRDGFTMNNSVYYDTDNKLVTATKIPENGIVIAPESKDVNSRDLTTTNIYIERMAAKVTVTPETDIEIQPYEVNTGQYLKFVPEAWSVTATEKKTYLIKHLPDLLTGLDPELQSWVKGSYRSYWCRSYSFGKTEFNTTHFPLSGCDVKNGSMALNYLSYTDVIANSGSDEAKRWSTETNPQYFLETTGRVARLAAVGINGKLAMPNAIIVGHYEVYSDKDATTKLTKFDNGFYIYASQVFAPAEIENAMLTGSDNYLRVKEGEGERALTKDELTNLFDVVHVHKYTRNGIPKTTAAMHLVAPQTTSDKLKTLTGLQYKENDVWKDAVAGTTATNDEIAAFNTFIVDRTNCASSYVQSGKAFYTVLVEHYGKVAEGTGTKEITGTYGLVRNHTYKISIKKIAGLASGINNTDDPLIPLVDETTKFQISAKLNVLAWHVVTQSGVEL